MHQNEKIFFFLKSATNLLILRVTEKQRNGAKQEEEKKSKFSFVKQPYKILKYHKRNVTESFSKEHFKQVVDSDFSLIKDCIIANLKLTKGKILNCDKK